MFLALMAALAELVEAVEAQGRRGPSTHQQGPSQHPLARFVRQHKMRVFDPTMVGILGIKCTADSWEFDRLAYVGIVRFVHPRMHTVSKSNVALECVRGSESAIQSLAAEADVHPILYLVSRANVDRLPIIPVG